MGNAAAILILIVVVALSFWLIPIVQDWLAARSERRHATAKGAALRGAAIEVFEIAPVDAPSEPLDDENDPLPRDFYEIDVAIEPAPGAPRRWSPVDLDIFDPEEDAEVLGNASADLVRLYAVDVEVDGEWVTEDDLDDDFAIDGAGRLLLFVGVHESVRRFGLVYFWEDLGAIELKSATDNTDLHESDP